MGTVEKVSWYSAEGIIFILVLVAFLGVCSYAAHVNKNKH